MSGLGNHPLALAAGRAMATWAWARTYSHEHGLCGSVPEVALAGSWVGERQARKDVARLVEVGLLGVVDGGWEVIEPRDPIAVSTGNQDEGRSAGALRSQRYRDRMKERDANRDASRVTSRHAERDEASDPSRDASRSLARSPSDLGSGSSSVSQLPDHPDSLPCLEPDPLLHPPAWRDEQVESVALARGRKPVDLGHCWARFVTTSQRDARAITPEAWKAFVVLQLGYDAADARRGPKRVVQRDPPGPKAFEVDDGNHDWDALAGKAKEG